MACFNCGHTKEDHAEGYCQYRYPADDDLFPGEDCGCDYYDDEQDQEEEE